MSAPCHVSCETKIQLWQHHPFYVLSVSLHTNTRTRSIHFQYWWHISILYSAKLVSIWGDNLQYDYRLHTIYFYTFEQKISPSMDDNKKKSKTMLELGEPVMVYLRWRQSRVKRREWNTERSARRCALQKAQYKKQQRQETSKNISQTQLKNRKRSLWWAQKERHREIHTNTRISNGARERDATAKKSLINGIRLDFKTQNKS